jgi:predicted PhzF superfamily epimerase YddE/YHI9
MRVHTLRLGHENQHVDDMYEYNDSWPHVLWAEGTGCPTRYRTRHFFNNSNINEDIATKFEQGYVHCVKNEEECVCSAPSCCDTKQRSAS